MGPTVTGLERTMRALGGAVLTPPACGATFVPLEALPSSEVGRAQASALACAHADARLDFAVVPSWEPWAAELAAALKASGTAAVWAVPGVLTTALTSVGYPAGLRAIGRAPGTLTHALEAAEASMLAAVADGIARGADAIMVADDLATTSGPVASPEYLAANVAPRLAKASAAARAAGVPALLHSDGDVTSLVRAIARSGFCAIHVAGVGPQAFERLLDAAHRERLAVVGGFDAQTLGQGIAAAVRAGARLATLARSRPLLVADDGGITTPKEYTALLAGVSAARGRT
jgi:hypothetical protein